jgi:hypothetical protein
MKLHEYTATVEDTYYYMGEEQKIPHIQHYVTVMAEDYFSDDKRVKEIQIDARKIEMRKHEARGCRPTISVTVTVIASDCDDVMKHFYKDLLCLSRTDYIRTSKDGKVEIYQEG